MYTEDIQAIAALGQAQGLVDELRRRTINITSGENAGLYEIVHQLEIALATVLNLTDALGRHPTMEWYDPAALRDLANELQREDDEDAAAEAQIRRDVENGRFL